MICVDKVIKYRGNLFIRVVIELLSNDVLCEEFLEALKQGDDSKFLDKVSDLVKMHGGCRILSETPIKIVSGDGKIGMVLEPANFFTKAYWEMAVERAREVCK